MKTEGKSALSFPRAASRLVRHNVADFAQILRNFIIISEKPHDKLDFTIQFSYHNLMEKQC
ncbi:hypothetical protein DRQ36_01565 [bacterium]|nr:MAG: hypothetical protein DRQ36_01565 [bacterium]